MFSTLPLNDSTTETKKGIRSLVNYLEQTITFIKLLKIRDIVHIVRERGKVLGINRLNENKVY